MPVSISGAGSVSGIDLNPNMGLTYIASASATAVSALSIDNCFNSSYKQYFVLVDLFDFTGAGQLQIRMRSGGSDTSTSTYSYHNFRVGRTGGSWVIDGAGATGQSAGIIGYTVSGYYAKGSIRFYDPTVSGKPWMVSEIAAYDSGWITYRNHNTTSQATQHDGFTIYAASGALSGEIKVYGYDA